MRNIYLLIGIILLGFACSGFQESREEREQLWTEFNYRMRYRHEIFTESDMVTYVNKKVINAERTSVSNSNIAGRNVRISTWEIDNHPTNEDKTFLTFIENQFESMISIKKPIFHRSYPW